MIEQGFYLADRSTAERAGYLESAYVTKDGKFILDAHALKRIRLTPEEFVTGIQGIEKIEYDTAKSLIAENGYRHLSVMTELNEETAEEQTAEEPVAEDETAEEPVVEDEAAEEEIAEDEPAEEESVDEAAEESEEEVIDETEGE